MAMKFNMKSAMADAKDVALTTAGMIASSKFLDKDKIFAKKIAADSTFTDGMLYKHFGGIKFAAAFVINEVAGKKMPKFMKAVLMGMAAQGLLEEARELTSKDGTPMFGMNNNTRMMNSNSNVDELLRKAAMGGVTSQYPTNVGAPVTNQYLTNVGRPNLYQNPNTSVSGRTSRSRMRMR